MSTPASAPTPVSPEPIILRGPSPTDDPAPAPDMTATREENGWAASAEAWIADMNGDIGDWSREHVLDTPMTARAAAAVAGTAARMLDVGCGEGRFCRRMSARGLRSVGLDPVEAMLQSARARHPDGIYMRGHAERLPLPADGFDLVVSYLTLIDIDDHAAAISEMARVLAPGGTLLVANLSSTFTANSGGWTEDTTGTPRFSIDHMTTSRADWYSWRGINVRNWHRPLGAYMSAFLGAGLTLTHYEEPMPSIGGPRADRYRRVPWFVVLEWRKPR